MRPLTLALVSLFALSSVGAYAEGTPATAPHASPTPPAATTAATAPATPPARGAVPPGVDPTKPVLPADVGKLIDPSAVPALQNILKPGTQLHYIGDEHGLKGYFATNGNRGQVVYVTADGQASLIGALFTADGVSMSMLQLTRLRIAGFDPLPYLNGSGSLQTDNAAAPAVATPAVNNMPATTTASTPAATAQPSLGEQLLTDASRASWIAFGQPTGVPLTVFMDPNCDHCHTFFKQLLPLTVQNKIYLRVIPISLVAPNKSGPEVINILSSTNPQQTWINKINGQDVPVLPNASPQAAAALRINDQTFGRWQLPGTPYSVYKDRTGTVKVLFSEPENLADFLKEIGVN